MHSIKSMQLTEQLFGFEHIPVSMNSGKKDDTVPVGIYGANKAFDQKTLKSLYPTHQVSMKKFSKSVLENLKADTSEMLNEAKGLSYLWK